MAKMIPQTLPYDAPNSEKRVFGLLRDSPVTEDWIVIWSYRPPQFDLESGRRREVDLVLLRLGFAQDEETRRFGTRRFLE
jgi:hypothetical protein